jgi:hypothetical protein
MLKMVVRATVAFAVAGAMLFGLGAATAGAQSSDECVFDGDLQSYLDCLAGGVGQDPDDPNVIPANTAAGDDLARTGSDVGSMVGIGSALVILGGATVYGVRQRRRHLAA